MSIQRITPLVFLIAGLILGASVPAPFARELFAPTCPASAMKPVLSLHSDTKSVELSPAETSEIRRPDPAVRTISVRPKPPTSTTRQAQDAVRKGLDFSDRRDFEDAQRGLIAPLKDGGVVKDAKGRIVWNLNERAVAKLDAPCPDSVNPSLWRQAQLLGIGGLFQVSDRIYQVRGLDLANITFVEGSSGVIVIDPLLSTETARAALDLYYEHRPRSPVVSVVITHSHPDHFGGIAGVVSEDDVIDGKVSVVAPKLFMEEVVSENVLAGNVMQRRAGYMYGALLPKGPQGDVGNGLGLGTSAGTTSLIKPTDSIGETGERRVIDGLTFEFQLTPGSEAPAEMHLYIHELKGLCPAENATHSMHNLYTLRGAKVRDARAWASYLQQTVELFGDRTDVLFAPHHWPIWGQERVCDHLNRQRDLYKYIHDQTLRLANHGYNMTECAEQIELPAEIGNYWGNRGYYGTLNHNVKAVWSFYLGWFDGHPARLHPLPSNEAATKYIEFMGGVDEVVRKAQESFERGEYRWVAQVLDHAVLAQPTHIGARELLADTLEQLGYQAESGPWRNFYLTGAQELRVGIQTPETGTVPASQAIGALPLDAIFNSLAVRLNSTVAAEQNLTINFDFTDTQEQYLLTMKDGVLNHFANRQHPHPDCTVHVTRTAFDEVLDGRSSFARQILRGEATINGKPRKLMQFFKPVEAFEPWFEMVFPRAAERDLNQEQRASL